MRVLTIIIEDRKKEISTQIPISALNEVFIKHGNRHFYTVIEVLSGCD